MRRAAPLALSLLALVLVSCPGSTVFEWMAFRPLQCDNNPWSDREGGDPIASPIEEVGIIADFFAGEGIELRAVGLLDQPGSVCLACDCPRGDLLVARVAPEDTVRLVREFDFWFLIAFGKGRWLAHTPVQCDGNPWQEVSPFEPLAEGREVRRWAAEEGADIGLAGSVFPTEPLFTCQACGCPRGDLLLASVGSAEDAEILRDFDFAPLSR